MPSNVETELNVVDKAEVNDVSGPTVDSLAKVTPMKEPSTKATEAVEESNAEKSDAAMAPPLDNKRERDGADTTGDETVAAMDHKDESPPKKAKEDSHDEDTSVASLAEPKDGKQVKANGNK